MISTPDLVVRNNPAARLRLYCFSYAGGSAANYAPWRDLLGSEIEVCAVELPGRAGRFRETPFRSMPDLVSRLGELIARQEPRPFAFFGHSLGALLAFEVARYLRAHRLAEPEQLIVSGCAAPRHRSPSRQLHLLGDAALVAALGDYNGTPSALLENAELMALLLPMIRADFSLAETYTYAPGPRLVQPITVLAGKRDPHTSVAQVEGWSEESAGPCNVHWFEGDHFFIHQERERVIDQVRDALQEAVCR